MSRNGCNFVKKAGWRCFHACLQANCRFIFNHLVSYPIENLLYLSFNTFIKIFFNFFLFNCIPYYNGNKHFSCLPSQLRLIVISAKPSIDLHDKSRKLSQFFKIPISWVLIRAWYLNLEVVSPWRIVLKWKKWNLRKRLLAFFLFLLVFIDYVVQHLEDDAKTNLEDGK